MEGQPFFTTIAGLAISLAGFGAVIAWLRDDPTGWDPINLWRLKTIVRHAISISFLCLALVPTFTITRSDSATIKVGSAMFGLFALSELLRVRRPDPQVWDGPSLIVYVTMTGALVLASAVNVALGSLGWLQVIVLILLTSPAGIFFNFVKEVGHRPGSVPDGDH